MEPLQLLHTAPSTNLAAMPVAELEAYFADAGLTVQVVEHCNDTTCPRCFSPIPARAA